jgi:transcription elongation factor GreA
MDNEPLVTSKGMEALEEKLLYLETTRRREVSDQMKRAVAHGDLSENAEYDEARNAYLQLEKKINETAGLIARATVIAEEDVSTEIAGVGSLVRVEEVEGDGGIREYRLVGPSESNPREGKISHLCPTGMSLVNSRIGDVVSVTAPGGTRKYKIIAITR